MHFLLFYKFAHSLFSFWAIFTRIHFKNALKSTYKTNEKFSFLKKLGCRLIGVVVKHEHLESKELRRVKSEANSFRYKMRLLPIYIQFGAVCVSCKKNDTNKQIVKLRVNLFP